MSSITTFQLGPLKFERHQALNLAYANSINLPYSYNKESGFIYNEILKSIVGKCTQNKLNEYIYQSLSSEDKKWASILKLSIMDDRFFNSLIEKVEDRKDHNYSKLLNEYNQLLEQVKLFQESLTKFAIPSGVECNDKEEKKECTIIPEKQYINDNQLNHQYRINMIEKFNKDDLLDFIKFKNGNVHECLLWCNWDVFNVGLVKYLVENKILDPFERTNVYDGSDATNLSFYMHCKLLKKDIESNYKKNDNWHKVSQIINYLERLLSGFCTENIF